MSIPFENIFHQIDMDLTSDGQHLVDSLATGLVKDDPHRRRSEHSCVAHPSGPDRQLFLLDTLPPCVRATSASFRMAFSDLLHPPRTPMDWMALEELSILMYKMSIIHLHRQLWLAYLQSGTGTMRSLAKPRQQPVPSLATHKWPSQVTLLIRSESGAQATNSDEIGEQTTYTNFVHEYLSELDERTRYYRTQFNTVANQLPIYSEVVGYQLSTFLSKSALVSARLHFTARIALIRHVYTDHLLQLEIWQQRPRVDHIQLANHVCQLTLAHAKATQEQRLFHVSVSNKKLPSSLPMSETSMPDVIVRINDPLVRVRLANEYRHVVDRTNIDLIHVLTAASEALRLDCEQALHAIVMDIRNDRLPTNLWSLVEQRQTNIKECIAYVYSFKIDSLLQIMNHAHL